MANNIDLASYVARFEMDSSGLDQGLDQADAGIRGKLSNLSGFMKGALVGGVVAIGASIVATIGSGIQKTAELEENLSKFQATTGATAEEVEEIRKISQDLYKVNTDSMEDIIATGTALKQAMGLTTEEIKGSQQAFMDYAKTTGQANTDVVGAIDDMGDAWGLSLDEMIGSLDMFKLSSEKFGTDVGGIQSAMQGLAPASKALGINFEETNGLLNMMAESGLDAGAAVTALNYAAKTVESPEQFRKMMEDIQAIEDPTARTQAAIELFGARAGVSMANVLDGSTSLEEFMITMADAEGTVASASGAFDNNLNVQLELAKKMFGGLTQELGEKFMPIINDILKWVVDKLPKIMEVLETLIDYVGVGIGFVIDTVKSMIGVFTDAESNSNETWNAIKDTISGVVDGIMEVVNGFIELFTTIWNKYGEDIMEFAKKNWESIKKIFEGVFNVITGIFQAFTALLSGDWKKFGEALKIIIDGAWKAIKGIFENYINLVNGVMNGAIRILSDIARTIMDGIWNAFKSVWDSIVRWIDGAFSGVARTISNFGRSFYNAGAEIFSSLWDGLKGVWSSISSWVSDKVSWIADKLKFWESSSDKMSDTSSSSKKSSSSSPRSLPSYAVGTPFVPSDQLAFLHKGEAVIPAKYNPYNGGSGLGGGDVTITNSYDSLITVHGNVDRDVVKEMEKVALKVLRENEGKALVNESRKGGIFPKINPLR